MGKRRSTPKLMNDLLSGKKEESKPRPKPVVTPPVEDSNTSLPESQNTSIPEVEAPSSNLQGSAPARQPDRAAQIPQIPVQQREEEKIKVTFYVDQELPFELDYARLQLLRLAPKNISKRQVSKSAIVEAALKIAIANLEQQGDRSALAQMLF